MTMTANTMSIREMTAEERTEFVNAYTRALIIAWSSEEFSSRLDEDPKAALAQVGLRIPEGGQVKLIRSIPEGSPDPSLDAQVSLWEAGLATGYFELHFPDTPQVDFAELGEGNLDAIVTASSACTCATPLCCCCPCCCCT